MPLLTVIVVLIAVGVLLWLVNSFIPMALSIKAILNAVVIVVNDRATDCFWSSSRLRKKLGFSPEFWGPRPSESI